MQLTYYWEVEMIKKKLFYFVAHITIEILCDPNLVRTAYDSCTASSRSALGALPSVPFSRNLPTFQMPQQQCRTLSDHNRDYEAWVLSLPSYDIHGFNTQPDK